MVEDLNGMEVRNNPLAAMGVVSGELLSLKSKGSSKPKSSHHAWHHRHHLRLRRDAMLPNSAYANFSTLAVALGSLSLGFVLGFTSPTQVAIIRDLNFTIA